MPGAPPWRGPRAPPSSGGRAGRALIMLEEAGFTKAFNAGGISDAREQRKLR